jgi:hypothetical protein
VDSPGHPPRPAGAGNYAVSKNRVPLKSSGLPQTNIAIENGHL